MCAHELHSAAYAMGVCCVDVISECTVMLHGREKEPLILINSVVHSHASIACLLVAMCLTSDCGKRCLIKVELTKHIRVYGYLQAYI